MKFKLFKTITYEGKPNLKDIKISIYAQQMLDRIVWPTEKQTFDLVKLTVKEMGFETATTKEIFDRAKEMGLELCPPELGAHLREQYTDQPLNERLFIVMKPITDADGRPRVFGVVRHDDGLWLSHSWALPTYRWNPEREFVFCQRKPLKSKTLGTSNPQALTDLEKRNKNLEKKIEKVLGLAEKIIDTLSAE